ncbi:uncharacterized protein KY384_006462 [Bacidia gigantensis]|uniref:uncharacterized protein n=1 Tax=Bacidia gigantensis TaxID=2732470 RepID=UPI001D03FC81|nr:uncharacterized protein KY384_006462 [Bacidia gigantensis]KAG8528774.1 hypothetical protein KY384_006462 [Bacidia gigantensis]
MTSYNNFPAPQEPLNSTGYAPNVGAFQPDAQSSGPQRLRRQRFEQWKRWLRILKGITGTFTLIFNAVMFGIMVWVNAKYYSTKDLVKDGKSAWPTHGTKVWPSIMLLAASGFTLVTTTIILIRYCWNRKKSSASWKITLGIYAVHITSWIAVSTLYRIEKSLHGNNNDLWGWSCANQANAVQVAFNGTIDFSNLCSAQLAFAIGHFYLHRKVEGQKQNLADQAGGATSDLLQNIF